MYKYYFRVIIVRVICNRTAFVSSGGNISHVLRTRETFAPEIIVIDTIQLHIK